MEQQPLKTVITIKSIVPSDKVPVFNVETMEGDKFQFWRNKRDGSETIAFKQYSEKRFVGGDRLEIFYNQMEGKPYQNSHTGKIVTPINKIITKFSVDQDNNPVYTPKEEKVEYATKDDIRSINEKIELINAQLSSINSSNIPVIDINKEDDIDLSNIPF